MEIKSIVNRLLFLETSSNNNSYRNRSSRSRSILIDLLLIVYYILTNSLVEMSSLQVVNNPEPIVVPMEDLVTFDCTMRLKPDRFEWLHLPKWPHTLLHANVIERKRHDDRGNSTTLQIKVDSKSKTGGYQCVAWYGAQAIASTPALLTIAQIGQFPNVPSSTLNVTAGNTVTLYCPAPPSDPPALIHYFRNVNTECKDLQTPSGALVLQNVTSRNSGEYTCKAENWITQNFVDAPFKIYLNVGPHKLKEAPKFLRPLPKNYTVAIDESVTLECSAIGTPPPKITWRRLESEPMPRERIEVTPVGLKLSHITRSDQGIYVCEANNGVMPSISHEIILMVHEMPTILSGPNAENATQGDSIELECQVKGVPEPRVDWVINSRSVLNDTHIEAIGNKIYISPVEKKHAGTVQCFASNAAGTVFSQSLLKVYPKPITNGDLYTEQDYRTITHGGFNGGSTPPANNRKNNRNNNKHPRKNKNRRKDKEMIPPSKPNITRLSDTSVMVRWNVPENDGMEIRFFKVQYREVSSNDPERTTRVKNSKWDTVYEDIAPNVNTYEVDNLNTDSVYKFRIAAIYSNNDNKLGPNSAKFHLQRSPFIGVNPLPTPTLTRTEAVDSKTIKIYWDLPNHGNATIEGFYINYRDVTNANDYIKETVDNATARSAVITYLAPGKAYEFKLQSFNAGSASDFSAILTQETHVLITESSVTRDVITTGTGVGNDANKLQIYIIIAVALSGITLLTGSILALVVCKRYRQKKAQGINPPGDTDLNDKRNSNELGHHIQAESKDYTKTSLGRRAMHNGCPPPGPKLTITPNPLAAATAVDEDKNQNVMEMSSFVTQNNNCNANMNCLGGAATAAAASDINASGNMSTSSTSPSSSAVQDAVHQHNSSSKNGNKKNKKGKTIEIKQITSGAVRAGENYV